MIIPHFQTKPFSIINGPIILPFFGGGMVKTVPVKYREFRQQFSLKTKPVMHCSRRYVWMPLTSLVQKSQTHIEVATQPTGMSALVLRRSWHHSRSYTLVWIGVCVCMYAYIYIIQICMLWVLCMYIHLHIDQYIYRFICVYVHCSYHQSTNPHIHLWYILDFHPGQSWIFLTVAADAFMIYFRGRCSIYLS